MDFWLAFWIAIIMGLVSWAAIKLGSSNIAALIGVIGVASVLVPILVITITGYAEMNSANGMDEMTKAASNTIANLFTWFGNNIQSIIAGDFAGYVLGAIFSIFK
jgi:hypothetical protein